MTALEKDIIEQMLIQTKENDEECSRIDTWIKDFFKENPDPVKQHDDGTLEVIW